MFRFAKRFSPVACLLLLAACFGDDRSRGCRIRAPRDPGHLRGRADRPADRGNGRPRRRHAGGLPPSGRRRDESRLPQAPRPGRCRDAPEAPAIARLFQGHGRDRGRGSRTGARRGAGGRQVRGARPFHGRAGHRLHAGIARLRSERPLRNRQPARRERLRVARRRGRRGGSHRHRRDGGAEAAEKHRLSLCRERRPRRGRRSGRGNPDRRHRLRTPAPPRPTARSTSAVSRTSASAICAPISPGPRERPGMPARSSPSSAPLSRPTSSRPSA